MQIGRRFGLVASLMLATQSAPASAEGLSLYTKTFVKVDAPVVALTHVRVIDGTGAQARAEQTIVIDHGRVRAVGDTARTPALAGATVLDLAGRTALPGLVGMHDHLFCSAHNGATTQLNQVSGTFPRLYLAAGVTTIRTTGSVEPYLDLNIKRLIDRGDVPGPKMFITAPYLEGTGTQFPQFHELRDADDARKMVDFWADAGATSFKAYMHITRAELAAAIGEAHARKLQVTGHLCSVRMREAAELGIDNLEHSFYIATNFVDDVKPDVCPKADQAIAAIANVDVDGERARGLIRALVDHHVALTSTLPVFDAAYSPEPLSTKALDVMLPEAQNNALRGKTWLATQPKRVVGQAALKKVMALERAFVKAGGLLVAGSDPTGIGGVLAGFGDHKEVELLVDAGFTPLEAIHIATANGAQLLGESARIGTIAAGKQADFFIVKGDPSTKISDIENVELVMKDGIGYDPHKLIESVRGFVGLQ